ncbi:hypothetical protein RIF29_32740 [Crotalaria pallida]|uniref:tRNA-binding domain-containing protein n=1 Tax=Crotalaria pallida TaxID=3830 RepID=A0AAN9EIJ5_CROPI
MANAMKAMLLSLSSSSLVSNPTRFLSKFPSFSISQSSFTKAPPGFPSFCTSISTDQAAPSSTTAVVAETDNNSSSSIKDVAGLLDLRVGLILKAWKHDEADSLYVEEVDIGEPQPRIICSGLVNYIPLQLLQGKKVIVIANLKPRNMRGVKSSGMLMAASDAKRENIELLFPPEEAIPGERIWFGLEDEKDDQPDAATPNQLQKKKVWELVQPHLKTDSSCVAMLGEHVMRTSAGSVACQSLQNANIS